MNESKAFGILSSGLWKIKNLVLLEPEAGDMRIHDGEYEWKGWGGSLRLASGKCRLRIYDLSRDKAGSGIAFLKPFVVVVSDIPDSGISVRSCAGHVATCVSKEFDIPPKRMTFIEYYPASSYGEKQEHLIPEKLETVEFTWVQGKAIQPSWRETASPLRDRLEQLIAGSE